MAGPGLADPEGGVVGGNVAAGGAEVPLQLDRVARRQGHHGLEREGGRQRHMGRGNLARTALISVNLFSSKRPFIRAVVLALTSWSSDAPKR